MAKFKIKDRRALTKKIITSWRITARTIFHLSQSTGFVPVKTGALRASGKVKDIKDGAIITYGNKRKVYYAAKQEVGIPPGGTLAVPGHIVKAHRRKTRSGKVVRIKKRVVAAHRETYPTGYPGKFYLTRAYQSFKFRLAAEFERNLTRRK